jgi:hypothetical protein
VASVELSAAALQDLIETRSLPADARERTKRHLEVLDEEDRVSVVTVQDARTAHSATSE